MVIITLYKMLNLTKINHYQEREMKQSKKNNLLGDYLYKKKKNIVSCNKTVLK